MPVGFVRVHAALSFDGLRANGSFGVTFKTHYGKSPRVFVRDPA